MKKIAIDENVSIYVVYNDKKLKQLSLIYTNKIKMEAPVLSLCVSYDYIEVKSTGLRKYTYVPFLFYPLEDYCVSNHNRYMEKVRKGLDMYFDNFLYLEDEK